MRGKGRKYSINSKNELQKLIWEYKKRKSLYKEENKTYGKVGNIVKERKYSLRRIEQKEEKVVKLAKLVEEFTEISVWKLKSSKNRSNSIAKQLFVKYGLENHYNPLTIGWYLGYKDSGELYRMRSRFQQSFEKHPENLEKWQKFKEFVKSEGK